MKEDMEYIPTNEVEIVYTHDISFTCEECLFFIPEKCECRVVKRFLYGQALRDDCEDGKYYFRQKDKQAS